MSDYEYTFNKIKSLFEKSKITDIPNINRVLIVLDGTKDRETFMFDLAEHLYQNTEATFIFLLAVRSYFKQAEEEKIELETLPDLVEKVKTRFSGKKGLFDVVFYPDEDISPFDRIKNIIEKRKIDLIIIPTPFTAFAKGEEQSEDSMGQTIDLVLSEVLVKHRIPVFLVNKKQDIPYTDIKVLIRKYLFRNDFLGWLFTILAPSANIDLYLSQLTETNIQRVQLYVKLIKEKIQTDHEQKTINIRERKLYLKDFCSEMSEEENTLLVFQDLKVIEEDDQKISNVLCLKEINTLIFPPKE
ncbi:MAG: hypothetical protein KAT16_05555 [Candidatus Heimdallarchaeota archaeon]|nr:hypothetical protein [Candidatus Heimdallarchaeota archaeon]